MGLVVATTSAVVLALLVPLALLLRTVAEERAVSAATQEAQNLAVLAATVTDAEQITRLVALVDERSSRVTTVVMADGTVVGAPVGDDPALDRARAGEALTVVTDDRAAVYAPVSTAAGTAVVRSVVDGPDLHRGVGQATVLVAGLTGLLLAAAVLAADRVAVRLAEPVLRLGRGADDLRAGDLDTRVPEEGPPEVVAAAAALNRLAARIEELLVAERDAVADLSHRLRTPMTALRLDADGITAEDPDSGERIRSHVAALERSVDAIVHDARRPVRSTVSTSCDAVAVVRARVDFWRALAEDQGRRLDVDLPTGAAEVSLAAEDLADVVDILVDNVFAHTTEGTAFRVQVTAESSSVRLVVADDGPGPPQGDPVARGASGSGSSGLGLDIARRAAAASGGSLQLRRGAAGGAEVVALLGRSRR